MDELEGLADFALSEAKKLGVDEAEVVFSKGTGYEVSVYQGDVDKLEYQDDHALALTLYREGCKGSASTTNFSKGAIQKIVAAANEIAKLSARDEYAALAPASLMATTPLSLDLNHPWALETTAAIALAKRCEATGLAYDSRICSSDGVSVGTQAKQVLYANTHGFCGMQAGTRHDITCVLIAKAKGLMERDYYYDIQRDAKDLMSVEAVAKAAAKRTVSRLLPRRIQTCKVPVIFSPELARGFFREFMAAISGGNLYRKTSFLTDTLGQAVFSPLVSIDERPHLQKALGSAWFDGDGVATRAKAFVTAGRLESYCLGAYSARRLGLETTGNAGGVHNLFVKSTAGDLGDLLKTMDTGLYVTDLLGHGGNLVTGDFSTGAFGYWVAGGEIQYPVTEFTLAGQLQTLYQQILAIGNDIDTRGNIQVGSVLFESMTVAGA